ncbi:hypothetical protein KJ567_05600 [Candidatus Bipolaricaulota bacterium]|nr:hypothetical protein [Candidatus Bipolaricaulota bacterium]
MRPKDYGFLWGWFMRLILCTMLLGWLLWSVPLRALGEDEAGCAACGAEHHSPYSDNTPTVELHAIVFAHNVAAAYQGLLVGEQAPFDLPWTGLSPDERVLVYVYDVRDPLFNPGDSFMLRILRDWSFEIPRVRFLVILTGRATRETQDGVEQLVGDGVEVVLDVDSVILEACKFDGTQPSVGFVLMPTGQVADRVRLPHATRARTLLEQVTVQARRPIPTEPTSFAAVHPLQVEARLWSVVPTSAIRGVSSVDADPGLPTLVYLFGHSCDPCEVATGVTWRLAREYAGRLLVLGLAGALSPEALASQEEYAARYPRSGWVPPAAPRDEVEREAYVGGVIREIDSLLASVPHPFPYAMDWDEQYWSVLGLWNSTMPGWALFDRDGRLVEVLPGSAETVNVDGVLVDRTNPTIEELETRIERLLAEEEAGT